MPIVVTKPEEVGLSSEALARIDDHLRQRYLESKKIAGALTLVARRGEVAYISPLGMMDLEQRKPMAPDTIFRIYSMSKPITSVALMTFYERAYFQLNDPVDKFIPEWRNLQIYASGNYPNFVTVAPERPMTMRDLMTHTSGLTYGFTAGNTGDAAVDAAYRQLGIGGGGGSTLRDMVEKLAQLPLKFSPGTHWNYSVSTDVLGYLVEVFSGMRFDEYLRAKIFNPLGMVDTDFWVPAEKLERFAANYRRRPDKTLEVADNPGDSTYSRPPTFFSGGGGLVSTASDYFRFCQMLLNGGELDGVRLLGRKTVELMTACQAPARQSPGDSSSYPERFPTGPGFGMALGVATLVNVAASGKPGSPGRFTWGGAAGTRFWVDPHEDLLAVYMVQTLPGWWRAPDLFEVLVYQALVT